MLLPAGSEVSASTHPGRLEKPHMWTRVPSRGLCSVSPAVLLFKQIMYCFILSKSWQGAGACVSSRKAKQEMVATILPRRARKGSILPCLSADNNHGFASIACCLSSSARGQVCSQNNVKLRCKDQNKTLGLSLLGTMPALSSLTSKL